MAQIHADFARTEGKSRPLHGGDQGPMTVEQFPDFFSWHGYFTNLNILRERRGFAKELSIEIISG